MRPITITLLLGVLSAICSALAAFYYPWPTPELTSERVNQPIFEAFDSKQVRSIEVVQFNDDRQLLKKIGLERKGEKWTLPTFGSFTASNISRISAVINSLSDCRVLQLESDQQTDHLKYQVLDPDDPESANSPSGMGQKVTLKDRNQKQLGSLIVGAALTTQDGQLKRFVRIPGEPQVYVVDFDATVLATEFSAWVDPNLLQIQTTQNGPGNPFSSMQINHYRLQPDKLAEIQPEWIYRGVVLLKNNALAIDSLERREGETWTAIAPGEQTLPVMQAAVSALPQINFGNVRAKGSAPSAAIRAADKAAAQETFQPMLELGFKQVGEAGKPLDFVATGGHLVVTFSNGLRITMLLGNVAAASQGESKLSRWVMFLASTAEEVLAKPEPPVARENSEITEDQQRAYNRSLEQWQERVKSAQQAAEGFNQLHAPWYYAVDEEVIAKLRPELPASK